jgi:biopolymer transport protein ExbB
MKSFYMIIYSMGITAAVLIYLFLLPEFIRKGGPLVIALILMSILVFSFIIERFVSLKRAQGKGSLVVFIQQLRQTLMEKNTERAISLCDRQQGSLANVVRAGLARYELVAGRMNPEKRLLETKRAIDEANALEVPLLERNLISLSTIASIGTMVGLLGTVIGMIRAFSASAHAGAPDASQLALGISEALINTAGGIFVGITGIVAYNYFVNRVDSFNYLMDEATYEMLQILEEHAEGPNVQG